MTGRAEAAPPVIDKFECISVTFHRGRGTSESPMRQCTAYYQTLDSGDMSLIAVYDPDVGIDPMRFPKDAQ